MCVFGSVVKVCPALPFRSRSLVAFIKRTRMSHGPRASSQRGQYLQYTCQKPVNAHVICVGLHINVYSSMFADILLEQCFTMLGSA